MSVFWDIKFTDSEKCFPGQEAYIFTLWKAFPRSSHLFTPVRGCRAGENANLVKIVVYCAIISLKYRNVHCTRGDQYFYDFKANGTKWRLRGRLLYIICGCTRCEFSTIIMYRLVQEATLNHSQFDQVHELQNKFSKSDLVTKNVRVYLLSITLIDVNNKGF